MSQVTMAKFSDAGVEVLDADGWREPDHNEWVGVDGGNYINFNAEGYASGWAHGLACGVLVAMFILGAVAVLVVR